MLTVLGTLVLRYGNIVGALNDAMSQHVPRQDGCASMPASGLLLAHFCKP